MIWTESDWTALAALVFRDDYPGNSTARGVVEAPNGDPGARDSGKKFAHVADKYLQYGHTYRGPHRHLRTLSNYNLDAYCEAGRLARQLGVPSHMWPSLKSGCLRVLEYPAGVGASHVHTDISLFTVNLWRNVPNPGLGGAPYHMGRLGELLGLGAAVPHHVTPLPVVQRSLVYFAIPDHGARLPGGMLVGEWLERELKTMRYEATT